MSDLTKDRIAERAMSMILKQGQRGARFGKWVHVTAADRLVEDGLADKAGSGRYVATVRGLRWAVANNYGDLVADLWPDQYPLLVVDPEPATDPEPMVVTRFLDGSASPVPATPEPEPAGYQPDAQDERDDPDGVIARFLSGEPEPPAGPVQPPDPPRGFDPARFERDFEVALEQFNAGVRALGHELARIAAILTSHGDRS